MNVIDARLARQSRTGATAAAAAKLSPVERAYRRCAVAFLTVFFGGIGLIYAFLLVVDPWDTGRVSIPRSSAIRARSRSIRKRSRRPPG
jgi:hypothetical protein